MTKKTWEKRIKKWCDAAGTYKPFFAGPISTLAGILERRDEAVAQFEASGGALVVEHENKGGGIYLEKNPSYKIIRECEQDALAYWRDLGLTPAGLRKINEAAMKKVKKNALAEALNALEG